MKEVESKPPGVLAARPVHLIRNLVTGCHASPSTVLQAQVRIMGSSIVNIDLGHAVTLGADASVKSDGGRIHIRIPAFLKLAEAVPAEPQCVDQPGVENVNLADREIICHCRGDAEPGTQLRTSAGPGAPTGKLVLPMAVKIAGGKRIGGGKIVIDFQETAIRCL